ncbi:hypothetical protein SAMN04487935_2178 [Flavobacterium noncentrifugens]|uniref:Lipoprotein n=2 Tax=Flavobacterium noncentrifugens TaxID=1128970 RepID=A0A1G8Y3P2_9FLAO|nr:hypothetical protein SAMN04487935_2178 [Flavobacterium noncentrifugens]
MKKLSIFIFAVFLISCNSGKNMQVVNYKIITTENENMEIDSIEISKLPKHLKAVAAFYAAMGGTNCTNETCELTTALGLGNQGSQSQIDLIKTYFPNDKVAETLIKQDCYLRPSGASAFSDFEFLNIIDLGQIVKVEYTLMTYDHGEVKYIKGPDYYSYNQNVFAKTKRNLWKHLDR